MHSVLYFCKSEVDATADFSLLNHAFLTLGNMLQQIRFVIHAVI